MLKYAPHARIDLRKHPDFNEAWLQERIAENPGILGLGDLSLLQQQRPQGKAGRLDLLLVDVEENRRFEVELMLGPTDPDHVIRTIEYWDIERRRYPAYDHVAVLVAEDITSRFLNVMSLLSGSIPLIAIHLNALEVEGNIVLDFVRVLDQTELRSDDTEESSLGEPASAGCKDPFITSDNPSIVVDRNRRAVSLLVPVHPRWTAVAFDLRFVAVHVRRATRDDVAVLNGLQCLHCLRHIYSSYDLSAVPEDWPRVAPLLGHPRLERWYREGDWNPAFLSHTSDALSRLSFVSFKQTPAFGRG